MSSPGGKQPLKKLNIPPARARDGRKKNGGARQGAGNPPKSKTGLTARKLFDTWFDEDFLDFYKALKDLALGHLVEGEDKFGNPKIYVRGPNAIALRYLMDRRMGAVKGMNDKPDDDEDKPEVLFYLPAPGAASPTRKVIDVSMDQAPPEPDDHAPTH